MKIENGNLQASSEELAAAAQCFDLPTNSLSRIPATEFSESDQDAMQGLFADLHEEMQDYYISQLRALAEPEETGVLHFTVDQQSLSRDILCWNRRIMPDEVVLLLSLEEGWEIRRMGQEDLAETMQEILQLETLPEDSMRFERPISSRALPAFLRICDLLWEGRLIGMVSHQLIHDQFSDSDLREVLEASGAEDFRWCSLFFEKLLPVSVSGLQLAKDTGEILRELENLELIQPDDQSEEDESYTLTTAGERVAKTLWNHQSKIGLRVTREREDGSSGHEVFFLVRSPHDVFLFDLAGKESVVASLPREGVDTLLSLLSGKAETVASEQPASESGDSSEPREPGLTCPHCNEAISPDRTQCPACGKSVETEESHPAPPPLPEAKQAGAESDETGFCPQCGAEVNPGAHFCSHCGKSLG